jgi:XTP/dITP diphosphohydrolase
VSATLCSRNEHKACELERLLPGWTIDLLAADEFPPEAGATYYENAHAKAEFGRRVGDPQRWMLGEDSGVEVAGLNGGPGVHSSRRAAGDEVGWLLRQLDGMYGDARNARYVCELVALSPEGEEFRGTGTLNGRITDEPSGREGFGFDPIFVPDGEERTVAQLGNEWKARDSHRARAAKALLSTLAKLNENGDRGRERGDGESVETRRSGCRR